MATYTLGSFTFNGDLYLIKDSTYESKAAEQGGLDVSLVTTGEKYIWNNKLDTSDIKTINSQTLIGSGDIAVQPVLNSTIGDENQNIKTINGNSILGQGNLVIQGGGGGGEYAAGTGISISSDYIISAIANGIDQPGIVSASTSSDVDKIWGTDSTGAPGWRKRDRSELEIDSTDSHQLNMNFVVNPSN